MAKIKHFSSRYVHSPVTFQGYTIFKQGIFNYLDNGTKHFQLLTKYSDTAKQVEIDVFNNILYIPKLFITEDWWRKLEAGQFIVRNQDV